jgi:drug/metabolite transporter (DMT)-like permease
MMCALSFWDILMKIRPEFILIFVTLIWGGTFLAVKFAVEHGAPMIFVGLRFGCAALLLWLVRPFAIGSITAREWKAGLWIGLALGVGYGAQTVGLQTITSSKSAFITAASVPMIPLLQWLILGSMPRLQSWLGISLAFLGLLLIAGPESGGLSFEFGEWVTLLCAFAVALEVIFITLFATGVSSQRVTVTQLIVASGFCLVFGFASGETLPAFSVTYYGIAVVLGAASALIQIGMNWAQKTVSPTRATIIYSGESVWAGIIGRIAGERLPALALLGGGMIVIGILVSELKLIKR